MNDLRQLRHFVALAEQGHFARAAEAVHLSQPALSRSIQALENGLGCRLVDRHSRGISLTAHGRLVLEHARRLLAGSRALSNAVSQLGNLASGELRLGAGPYPAARLVPRALGAFARQHPGVHLQLLIDNWQQLHERLLNGEVELFIADCRELQGDPQLRVEALPSYPGVLFCHPRHPLLQRRQLQPQDLLDYPLAGTQLPTQVAEMLSRISGREQPLSIACDNFMVLKELVSDSTALSMAPWDVVAQDIAAGRLALLPLQLPEQAAHSAYGIVSRAGHSLSPAAQRLCELLREQATQTDLPAPPGDLANEA
ncbi:LysR family transcriptional regulator [Pseudomonas sp. CAU 1711]|uniref:LysR family transcriptional regulator n=1 Tax=Pseudomonas sp. CAU 1711 TaxID=3140356 RepID=UPI0032603482